MFLVSHGDALRELLPAPAGWVVDPRLTSPWKPEPNTIYLVPRRFSPPQRTNEGGNDFTLRDRFEEAPFRWRIVVSAASKGEQRNARQDRSVSEILDDAVDAIVAAIDMNPRSELWWDLYVEAINYDALRAFDVRNHWIDIVERVIPGVVAGYS